MRKNNFKQGFREVRGKLRNISTTADLSLVEQFNRSITIINDFLTELRDQVVSVRFADKFEEIYFFKFEKPEYYALKIYHVSLFTLVNQKPAGTPDLIRAYYMEELRYVARFFKQHAFHYEYFRSGFTELDDLLFLREASVQAALLPETIERDAEFSTSGDYLFAKFTAYELLQEYIIDQLKLLDRSVSVTVPANEIRKRFDWTGEVINLVELGYGLYLSKQIGGGKAGLQEIFNWLEESFGIEIGIPANRFRELKRRKRLSRTHLMELIRDALIAYMDEDNEL